MKPYFFKLKRPCLAHYSISLTLRRIAQHIELTMPPEIGALFLLRRASILASYASLNDATEEDRELALEISRSMNGLPLALEQAGAYIEETACNLSSA